jgi:DNA (cytosine-5)-methyltransferase 1
LLREVRPKYAIFENVTNLLNGNGGDWFKRVLWDISQVGYDAEWHCISASELGAHHHRDRAWIIADPKSKPERGLPVRETKKHPLPGVACKDVADTPGQRQQGQREPIKPIREETAGDRKASIFKSVCIPGEWSAEPDVGRVAYGVSERLDRLKGLGNAVVPQIPEIIGRAIMSINH